MATQVFARPSPSALFVSGELPCQMLFCRPARNVLLMS